MDRHGGAHAEFSGFIGARSHNASVTAPDNKGYAVEFRIGKPFAGDEKRVHIDVYNSPGHDLFIFIRIKISTDKNSFKNIYVIDNNKF